MFVGSTVPPSGWLLNNGIVASTYCFEKSCKVHHTLQRYPSLWSKADYAPYVMSLFGMLVMVVLGTWLGKWCLNVFLSAFILITKSLLGIIVLKILISEVPKIIQTTGLDVT